MAHSVLVDTSGWYALIDRRDANHGATRDEVQRLIGPEQFDRAEALFRKYRDQAFSFTDCTSFAGLHERRIREVITGDGHSAS